MTDTYHGPVAQLGERYNRTVEVKGSNPFRSTPQKADILSAFLLPIPPLRIMRKAKVQASLASRYRIQAHL